LTSIPIKNIYFLLCYAWNRLEERDIVAVSTSDAKNLLDLFARVLINGTSYLIRHGLHRSYIPHSEDTSVIRGHLDVSLSIKKGRLLKGRAICEYDDLNHNILHNQIIRTTIKSLITHPELDSDSTVQLNRLYRHMTDIDLITLTAQSFSRVRLHRNCSLYSFLLSICRLIFDNVIAKEGAGDFLFMDFVRDPKQMARLFEDFVRNFYRIELSKLEKHCQVHGAEKIDWVMDEENIVVRAMLPQMKTDISIEWPEKYLIIDTKYYSETFQSYYDKKSIHSAHLNQLFSYLMNIGNRGDKYAKCEGMLLYPTVDEETDLCFPTHGHKVLVRTVDLNKDWKDIHKRLLRAVN
jgi:5-methylcytosine-specific restriction enzyme subunit McrC